jgi:hypothetical protein
MALKTHGIVGDSVREIEFIREVFYKMLGIVCSMRGMTGITIPFLNRAMKILAFSNFSLHVLMTGKAYFIFLSP